MSAPDALAFLDAQADKWAAEVNLPQMVAAILSLPDRPQRIEAEALARQAFIEGAYRAATALRTPHGLPGEALKFRKEHYGATVATLIDTEDTIVEISARPDGDYELIVHNREGERDTFRDCSALLKPKHFAALGTLANRLSPASREDV